MTQGKLIPFEVALKREDRRLSERKAREENVRRKLLPLMVTVCETYKVTADDILDAQNKHPTVVMARNIVRWLGWSRFHVGTTYLAVALNQSRVSTGQMMPRLKKRYAESPEFRRQVECVEKLLDAVVK